MNNIEKQYENLIKMADKIALNEDEKLTDEQVEEFCGFLDSLEKDHSQEFPSNNGKIYNENTDPEQNVINRVLVSSNPTTGILNTIPYNEDNITEESLDKLLELENEDLKKIEIDFDTYTGLVKGMYNDLNDDDLNQLFESINRYRSGEDFSYFNSLPESIKKEINTHVNLSIDNPIANMNAIKQMRNMMAKELFDMIIANNYSSKAFTDISKFTTSVIDKEKEKLGGSIHEYNGKLREEYEVGFIKKAEALENSNEEGSIETANNLRKASRMFTQSYTYEDMYEMYSKGKIKVKNIQIEKFNRTCSEFNRKYYNNTFKINDVGMVVPVLDRVLDNKYNITAIKKFVVAFINYTKNFNPSNIDEHVFMYYFIQNILALDIKIGDNEYNEFNEILINNINKFIDLIIEKDNQKEELKKGSKNNEKSS